MAGPIQVGDWIVDPASRELRPVSAPNDAGSTAGGTAIAEPQRLGHKPLSVLQRLAESPGSVVTKDDLIDSVWEGAITTDDAVMAVIYELRKALGDDAKSPRYVETIRQRGYRLVADVRPVDAVAPEPRLGAVTDDRPRRRLRPIVPVFALGFLVAMAMIVFDAVQRRDGRPVAEAGAEPPSEAQVEEIPEIRSLAIRPLAAFGELCVEEPSVDSLTELLIAELVNGPPLEILGSGDGGPWPAEPTADAVIEGSIIRSGEGLWVNVRLVESATGRLIWGASYERHGVDILLERALASKIARDVQTLISTEDDSRSSA